jgi:hypothetical protein
MPSPMIAMSVIAVKKAVMAPVFVSVWVRSFKLEPQRLQKLRPGVMVVPQVEQNINSPSREYLEKSFPAKRNGCGGRQVPPFRVF